jgi:hypothetical protein
VRINDHSLTRAGRRHEFAAEKRRFTASEDRWNAQVRARSGQPRSSLRVSVEIQVGTQVLPPSVEIAQS